jgi:hypothetical protein
MTSDMYHKVEENTKRVAELAVARSYGLSVVSRWQRIGANSTQ